MLALLFSISFCKIIISFALELIASDSVLRSIMSSLSLTNLPFPASLTYPESLKNVIVSSASDLVIFKALCKFLTFNLPVAASSFATYAASSANICMSSSVCALFICLSNKALPCESIGFCLTLSRCAESGPIEDSNSSIVTSALGSVVPVLWRSCAILNASSLGRSAKGMGLNGVLVSLAACVGSACSLATLLSTAV